uniref:Uncharacterized protein n=1 Tax=Trepomonas sp. PC1 TaxID=1076344 RepID=A0A146KCF6_9EUKA|eukprot:JAP93355.1 Hypothetical protein TPC1_14402 [Trepomonas sp. PC1]
MSQVFFVHCPRGIRISEAKELIKKSCDCEIKSAAHAAFFVKVNSGDLKKITTETYGEEKNQFSVEIAQKATVANWDELRKPFIRKNGERKQKTEGDVVREKKPYVPREKTDKPYVKRERTEKTDKPVAERKFRAFVLPREKVTIAAVEKYFTETLKTAKFQTESKDGKDFHFFAFTNLDDCRAARAAFRENPMENVTVRPFIPFHKRQQKPE